MTNKHTILQAAIELVYPRRCPICSDIVTEKGQLACTSCMDKPVLVKEPRCKKCGKSIEQEEALLCYDCSQHHFHFNEGYGLWIYDSTMRKSISDFKYKGRKEYADFYVEEAVKQYGKRIQEINPDLLVPVPLHRQKERQRGFNQAQVVASLLGKKLHIPTANLLIRNRNTLPQKELSNIERIKNLSRAFEFSEKGRKKYEGSIEKVMLIDDIYTTGSTIEACTNILKAGQIKEVYFFCICIGKGF